MVHNGEDTVEGAYMSSLHCPWRATYTPGRWIVLSGPSSLVILQPAPAKASDLLNRIWHGVVAASSVNELVSELVAWGLKDMPNLGVLLHDGSQFHCLLRGEVKVVDHESGTMLADGSGAITWREVQLTSKLVRIDMEAASQAEQLELPLIVGAVAASSLLIDARDGVSIGHEDGLIVVNFPESEASSSTKENGNDESSRGSGADPKFDAEAQAEFEPVASASPVSEPKIASDAELTEESSDWVTNRPDTDDERTATTHDSEAQSEPAAQQSTNDFDLQALLEFEQVWPINYGGRLKVAADVVRVPVVVAPKSAVTHAEPERAMETVSSLEEAEVVSDNEPDDELREEVADAELEHDSQNEASAGPPVEPDTPQETEEQSKDEAVVGQPEEMSAEDVEALRQDSEETILLPDASSSAEAEYSELAPVDSSEEESTEESDEFLSALPPPPVSASANAGDRSAPHVRPLPEPDDSDHDGSTIFTEGVSHKPTASAPVETDMVLAAMCPFGHSNAPGSQRCRVCGSQVDSHNPRLVPIPVLTTLVTNDGQVVPLTGPIVVGRAPTASGEYEKAQLLRVLSPNQDVSRSHLCIIPVDWGIEVRDLHSTNGTLVHNPGEGPFLLAEGESVNVEVGANVDLGDDVIIEFRPGN